MDTFHLFDDFPEEIITNTISTKYQQNILIKEITNYVFYRSCPSPPTIPNVNIFFSFAYLENIMNSFQLRPAWW